MALANSDSAHAIVILGELPPNVTCDIIKKTSLCNALDRRGETFNLRARVHSFPLCPTRFVRFSFAWKQAQCRRRRR